MVTLDRRKLAVPLVAQAAAFVAVLVVGGFTGHTSSTTTGAGATLKLTVKVAEQGTADPPVAGSQVDVLDERLASVASGTLSSALEFAANVPAGQYQVCVSPPIGWASAVHGTHVLGSWICSAADLRTAPQQVTFRLTLQVPQVGQ